jgi:NAD(P)-dependent dehydrogenase (short-subunit alcohol dehydrogenase family)
LVNGANRGIGRSIIDSLINRGASKVYAAVRHLDSAGPLADQYGDRIVPVRLELTDPRLIAEAAAAAADAEIVINNAGVLRNATPLADDAVETLQFEIDINVFGLMRMAQAFGPVLKANGGGAFVQLNSIASMKSFADFATYSASKAASYSITQALRDLWAEQGTHVVSVHPGPIDTEMAASAGLAEMAEPASLVSEAICDALSGGDFHVFPDSMAKQLGQAYQSFAESVIDADLTE